MFVFIQPERKTPFEYYGRALPLRIQINWEPDIPSRIAFDLVEYNAQKSKTTGMFLNNHSNLILHDSEAPHNTVKDAFVTVRAAQTLYRQRALQLWGNMCAVTSVDNPGWLIASHIKPWRESSDVERVDPANSLMLTPNYDKLFDRGVISFSPDNGKIILPNTQTRELWNNLNRMHIDEDVKLRYLPDGIRTYLEYHNNYVFNFTPKDNRTNDEFVEDLLAKAMA